MLARAAEFTATLCLDLLEHGFQLKDATPANVLFRGSEPVWVDVPSIVAREPGTFLWRSRPIRALFLAAADREPRSGDSARLVPARRGAWSRSRDAGGNSRRSPLVEAVVVGIGRITERTAPGCTGAFVARPAAVAQRRAGALHLGSNVSPQPRTGSRVAACAGAYQIDVARVHAHEMPLRPKATSSKRRPLSAKSSTTPNRLGYSMSAPTPENSASMRPRREPRWWQSTPTRQR